MNSMAEDIQLLNCTASEWEEFVSYIDYIDYLLGGTPLSPPHLPPPQLCNQDGWFPTSGAAPQRMEKMYAADVCYDVRRGNLQTPGTFRIPPPATPAQYQSGRCSFTNLQTPETFRIPPPAAPQIVQVMSIPDGPQENMQYCEMLGGKPTYMFRQVSAPTVAAAAPPVKKTKVKKKQSYKGPYVKKPSNAFMLFLKEQRQSMGPTLLSSGSSAVNKILGQRWKSLSKEEQSPYYQQAQVEQELHRQQNPNWTAKNNYGINKKRDRSCPIPLNSPSQLGPTL